jgi:hypothetical protein
MFVMADDQVLDRDPVLQPGNRIPAALLRRTLVAGCKWQAASYQAGG